MAPPPKLPQALLVAPFRGSDAVRRGLLTRRMLMGKSWTRLFPDIYVCAEIARDHRVLCQAAGLLLPQGGAIAMLSAAYLWGVDLLPLADRDTVSVTLPADKQMRRHPGLSLRYSALDAADVVQLFQTPLTSAVRTAYELARHLEQVDAVIALDALLHKRKLRTQSLSTYANDRKGQRGNRRAQLAISLSDSLAESPMETRVRLLLLGAGLPRPVAQYQIFNGKKFVARVDFAYPERRIAIEYDGDHHRLDRSAYRFDMQRSNELRLLAWTTLHFNADDVLIFPERLVAQVKAALR